MKKSIIIALSAIVSLSAVAEISKDSAIESVLDQFHNEVSASLFAEKKKVITETTNFNLRMMMGDISPYGSSMIAMKVESKPKTGPELTQVIDS